MRIVHGALALIIGIVGFNSPASAFSAVGLRNALQNCLNKNVAPPERIEACNAAIHTNVLLSRDRARLITSRGNAQFASANLESALDDYNKAVELNSDLQAPVVNRAITLLRLGRCEQAAPDFGAILASDARSWLAVYGRSLCEAKADEQMKAQSDLAAATSINPNAVQEFAPVEISRWFQ